jgi:hypothetical protein
MALGLRSGWYIVIPIRDVRVRARFDLVATPFDCVLRDFATRLGNFVLPAGLRVRRLSALSTVACLSGGLQPSTLSLVRDNGRVGGQRQSVQSALI